MRNLFYIALGLVCWTGLSAQPYGNEWIDFSKQYLRIQTAENAMYRISYADLANAGFPVNTVDPRRLQLFFRGEEVAIYVAGQNDAVFNPNDYIEFYGQKNDGTVDAELYKDGAVQPHELYNLFSDTTSFFLTYHLTPSNGRRMASYSENNVNGLPPVASHRDQKLSIFTNTYAVGERFAAEDLVQLTRFDTGEGWSGKVIQEGEQVVYSIDGISDRASPANARLEVLLQGRDNVPHKVEILVSPDQGVYRSVGTVTWNDYSTRTFTADLSDSDIGGDNRFFVKVICQGTGENDLISTSFLRLSYGQQMNANGSSRKFFTLNPAGSKSYVEINNVPAASLLYDVTDPRNPIRIGATISAGQLRAIIQSTSVSRELLLTNTPQVPVVRKASIQPITTSSSQYVIISHRLLRKAAGGYQDPVKAIAAYRAGAEGGGYDTLVVTMDRLYDMFSYGETTPLAIYRFMRYLYNEGNPEYLFLIGKGMDVSNNFHRDPEGFYTYTRFGNTYQLRDLVPSAGLPASDAVFTAGLAGDAVLSPVATGRLPATNSSQVAAYLDKVIAMESQPYNSLFRKDILHLSGGISAQELLRFNSYVNSFARIAEDPFLGGKVTTVKKNNTEIVSLINISEEINQGKNLVTFFGHSAPNVTDIDIGFVSDPSLGYNNPDKYPMFLLNGCLSGEFFSDYMVFGEDWMLAKNKGAIGFFAHTSFGFENTLRRYSELFYETAYGDSTFIDRPIGQIHKEVARRYMENAAITEINISQVQQMIYLGDPATYLFGAPARDYETNSNQLFLTTENDVPLTGQLDQFILNVIVRNFGKAYADSLDVHVTRTLSNGNTLNYDSIYPSPLYTDTLKFVIPNLANGAGQNQFAVQLDPENSKSEINENNNNGILNFFIPSNSTANLYPTDYGIVSGPEVKLLVQSTDPLPQMRSFTLQLDTSRYFTSPVMQQTTVNGNILAHWDLSLPVTTPGDSIVYYWRSKYAEPGESESDQWANSSFTLIPGGSEGWTQRDYFQFTENSLDKLQTDDDSRTISLQETFTDLYVNTGGAQSGLAREEVSFNVNNSPYIISGQYCAVNTINFVAFNKTTAIPYLGLPYTIGDPRVCGRQPQIINSFSQTNLDLPGGIVDYIDAIPDGDEVVVFTIHSINFSLWSAALKTKMQELGLTGAEINSWVNGEPVIVIGKKGAAPGSAQVIHSDETPVNEQLISYVGGITGFQTTGTIRSKKIGPAREWDRLYYHIRENAQDAYRLDLLGIRKDGTEEVVIPDINSSPVDLSTIAASQYPSLRLTLSVTDEADFTAPVLKDWLVSYILPPEGIIFAEQLRESPVNVQQGATVENSFGFVNVSNKSFPDSLTVTTELFNTDSRKRTTDSLRILAPLPGDTTRFNVLTETKSQSGTISYTVNVNPLITPEQTYTNNLIDLPGYLHVHPDEINPVVDVVFDGEYILDGDIVSPTPLITARIKDDNQFLLKKDTLGVNLLFKPVCEGCEYQRIAFSSDLLQWYPAEDDAPFRLEFRPEKLEDGLYSLRLEAADASGNKSGEEPYEITFEVINESTITNFYPYPNPFSSSTRFVFTLTGGTIPEAIKIQIMTVSGKVVREITQDELGPIHIGHNLTDYAWDGRDEYGDQLANGVYLYRVLIRNQGDPIEHRATAGDKGFNKGYGKLYLLR